MRFFLIRPKPKPNSMAAICVTMVLFLHMSARLFAATVGTVTPILGTPGNIAYDAINQRLFISDTTQNRIEVYSLAQGLLLSPIPVGHAPVGIAIVPESNVLLVCNTQDTSLTVISLSTLTQTGSIPVIPRKNVLSENPFSIASLSGGGVLLSTNAGLQTVNVAGQTTTPVQTTKFNIPPNSSLVATGDRTAVLGQSGGLGFIYNPALSQPFEQFRTLGNSSLLASDQTGAHFMIGALEYNRQFSNTNGINPFASPAAPIGGVAFSADSSSLYAGYNQTPGATITVLSLPNLQQISSFRVPEAITGPMTVSPDGSYLFAISVSGLTVVNLTALPALPAVQISKHTLFFSFQACNLTPATQTVQITNSAGGTFSWKASASLSNVTLSVSAGNGPSALQVTFNPSALTFRGTAVVGTVTISSPESISGDQTLSLAVNLTNPDQIGSVYPADGYLSDILIDNPRQRVYLVNSTKNEIEVYSIAQHAFLAPVPVGSIPKSIALTTDGKLLVANLGSEYISEVDANTLALTGSVLIPPPPLPGPNVPVYGTHPFSVAQASSGLTLIVGTTFDSSPAGTVYGLPSGSTTPVAATILGNVPNTVSGLTFMAPSLNGNFILLAETAGTLHLYDDTTGNFAITRTFPTGVAGNVAASVDGTYYHVDTQVLSSVLAPQVTIPSGITSVPVIIGGVAFSSSGGIFYRGVRPTTMTSASPAPRIEELNAAASTLVSGFNIAEGLLPDSGSLTSAVARQLAIDSSATNLYGISDSGLIVIPLSVSSAGPQINPGGIVNGASFAVAPAPVAPGSIASVFGLNLANGIGLASVVPLPTELGGACITFNGYPAPLFFASPGQLNLQIPWELAGQSTAQVAVGVGALSSQPVTVSLAQLSPGIFTLSQNGAGGGAILHQNFSPVTVSNPATIGEFVSIFATGFGPVSPAPGTTKAPPGTGQAAPTDGSLYVTNTPAATIGGVSAPVQFSGLAVGFVGLYQVNVQIPANAPLGTAVPVVISFGTNVSNTVTMPIIP